jgi:DNA-binding transcriptional ArsR family regulator
MEINFQVLEILLESPLEKMMQEQSIHNNTGWTIGESICMELDVALTGISGRFDRALLPEDMLAFFQSVPTDWANEIRSLLGSSTEYYSILETAAVLAGVLPEADYGLATLAIRELAPEAALKRMEKLGATMGIDAQAELPLVSRLVDLYVRIQGSVYQSVGFDFSMESPHATEIRHDIEVVAQILYGGSLHTRFWHWLDRFYYELYRPWRQARQESVEKEIERASGVLGARQKNGVPPKIAWLPAQSPLLRYPELTHAVKSGDFSVFFWAEPFGMIDLWGLMPGMLVCSFAESSILFQNFLNYSVELARRAQALADPTRLVILRIIRYFAMDNTEIASYLGLSRPTVSIHARILRDAGLIRSHEDGRSVRHEVITPEVYRLFSDLEHFLALTEVRAQKDPQKSDETS